MLLLPPLSSLGRRTATAAASLRLAKVSVSAPIARSVTVSFSPLPTTPVSLSLRVFHAASPAQAKKKGKMPPKKKVVEDKKVILGRPGNNLKASV